VNFAQASLSVAWAVVRVARRALLDDGRVLADEQTHYQRLLVCHECPHAQENRCSLCGCYLSIKTTLAASECPAGKWVAQ
jgi:hypothetical protein